jgi:hypothetical protein
MLSPSADAPELWIESKSASMTNENAGLKTLEKRLDWPAPLDDSGTA